MRLQHCCFVWICTDIQGYISTPSGTCQSAGYTCGCCTRQTETDCRVPVGVSQYCFCDEQCHVNNDCCADIHTIQCFDGELSSSVGGSIIIIIIILLLMTKLIQEDWLATALAYNLACVMSLPLTVMYLLEHAIVMLPVRVITIAVLMLWHLVPPQLEVSENLEA